MKQRTSGFSSLLIVGLVAVGILGYLGYRYEQQSQLGGTSIQTQLSDTIGTFRTNTNTNFSTIDSEIASITSTQATYGTIVTVNSPVPPANGGTGTSTAPTANQFLSANSSNPAWKTLIFGGGLNSTTTATSVSINTTGFDPTANYAFTGNNTHTGTETFNATTSAPYLAPVGAIEAYVSSTAPNGWLLCNGTEVPTATYPSLFALIGYTYGGSTSTFKTPNIGGRTIFGPSSTLSTTIGTSGGTTSTVAIPQFSTTNLTNIGFGGGLVAIQSITGTSTTVPIMPPYIIEQYIIKF